MADDLLHRLGAIERENDAAYPREWEQVVAGTMSAEEAKLQRAQDSTADTEAYKELFSPLGPAATEALVDRLQAALAEATTDPRSDANTAKSIDNSTESAASAPSTKPELDDLERGSPRPISLVEVRTSKRRMWLAAASTLVAAAAVFALWLRPVDNGQPGATSDTFAPYSLVIRNKTIRGDRSGDDSSDKPETAPSRYRADSMVHWVLSPDEARSPIASKALKLRAWAIDGTEERSITPTRGLTISESGVVVLRGSLSQLFDLPPGRWTIHLAITTGELPTTLDAARQAAARSDAQFLAPLTIEVID